MKKKNIIQIAIVIVLQAAFIILFILYKHYMTPRMDWQHAMLAAIYSPGSEPSTTFVDVEAMVPYDSPFYVNANTKWYDSMLTIVSASFIEESNYEEIYHEVISSTQTFLKYRLYNKSGMEWIVWVDLKPIISTNYQPRIAIERGSYGGGL